MRGITAVLIGLALLLSACSGSGPESLPLPSADGSPSQVSTSSPDATPTDEGPSASQVQQFAATYLDAANAGLSGEPHLSVWRELFTDSCGVCLNGYSSAAGVLSQGNRIEGGTLVDWQAQVEEATDQVATIVVTGDVAAATVLNSAGDLVEEYPAVAGVTVIYTAMASPDGTWRMIGGQVVQ